MSINKQLKEVLDRVTDPYVRMYYAILLELIKEVPEIKWIDLDHGQLEDPENGYQLIFPCCLIDFPRTDWIDTGELIQDGSVTVQFRIGYNNLEDFNNKTPDEVRVKGLERFAINTKLHKAMHGFHSTFFNRLTRNTSDIEKGTDPYKVYTFQYSCRLYDDSAQRQSVAAEVTGIDVNVNVE